MDLPVMPPVRPMLAKAVAAIPPGMRYEAKWDGFRAIVFRDGDEVELGSRSGKPLTRYFPELVEALRARLPRRCVLDGEIVIAREGRLDFDALLERVHPADSRVRHLAATTPASFVAFDLLALDDRGYLDTPFDERRRALALALRDAVDPVFLAPPPTGSTWPGSGSTGTRAPGWMASSPSAPTSATGRASGSWPRSSTSGPRTASSRVCGTTSPGPSSAPCCSACTTTAAGCSTSA
ncbi:hypothetical protein NKH77_06790 [Streptomyces sp. M19]